MPTTIININAVEDSTARAKRQITAQEDALNNIDRIINSMEGAWESEAQKVYTDRFRDTRQRIQRFNESVNASLDNMRNFVNDCVSADELTAREIRRVNW